jgi:hypothetical protein
MDPIHPESSRSFIVGLSLFRIAIITDKVVWQNQKDRWGAWPKERSQIKYVIHFKEHSGNFREHSDDFREHLDNFRQHMEESEEERGQKIAARWTTYVCNPLQATFRHF